MNSEPDKLVTDIAGEADEDMVVILEMMFDKFIRGFENYIEEFGDNERNTVSTTLLILKNIRPLIKLCETKKHGNFTNSDILGRTLISVVLAFMLTESSDERMAIYDGVHILLTAFTKGDAVIGVSGVNVDEILSELRDEPDTVGSC